MGPERTGRFFFPNAATLLKPEPRGKRTTLLSRSHDQMGEAPICQPSFKLIRRSIAQPRSAPWGESGTSRCS